MGKLVVLRLDGEAREQGFRVTLAIGLEGAPPEIELTGYLPAVPELAHHIQHHWLHQYRSIGAPYRIKPKKITYDGSLNQRLKECQESANELRDRFKAWLDCESFRPLDRRLREELSREEEIRFLIRTEDRQLQKLPWHLWDFFEHYSKAEIGLSGTTFERPNTSTLNHRTATVKILAILGHSEGLDIEKDRQLLENLPNAETTFLVENTRQEITDQLWEQPWDIIFFAGHSETQGETGRIYINPTESLTINELWYALKKAVERGLKLAIFNSCDGLGLAQQLNDLQIPQMIVMRELVPDRVAQEFLKHFLMAFAGGQPFYLAVREAREQLQGLESIFPCASWLPVICQNPTQVLPLWDDWIEPTRKQPKRGWRGWQSVLVASIAATGLAMGVRSLGWLQSWELNVFDQFLQLRPAEVADPRLLVVKVTAEDIEKLGGEYPLSDRTLLQLLQKLEAHQPRVIGLDIYRDRPEGEGHTELVEYFQKSDSIVPVCMVPAPALPSGVAPPPGVPGERLGFGDVVVDPDDIVRRHLIAMEPPAASPCSTFYALSSQLALHYLEKEGISPQFISENDWQLGSVRLKNLAVHRGFYQQQVGLQGFQILLNYRFNNSLSDIAEQVTLTDVLTNQVNPNFLKDKIVLVGVTDPTVKDDFQTPYHQDIRGVMLHAYLVSQIISAVADKRPLLWFFPLWIDTLWIWGWSTVGGILTWYFLSSPRNLGLAVGVALITLNGISLCGLFTTGGVLPIVPSALALVAASGGIVAYRVFGNPRSH
ncbi:MULTISPECIES: CHASE2 domain-containing protein [unclassified Coleofasciculus]|uniref:CHASE2 domain-containing protein n=1 Tax=unclassified Coleofasciculus TaxID=2692782 RepID=UPI001880CC59|nr:MULTISPECIES: CHASE2 domain-containing protein [unclassified Coleofasciculus]MBE9128035.1 CHASE2 domain-containing protein [Coleofasciculus sp. LEGE 07081]MBE9151132.1 CHASE2 domain-containing protein [Coleofasciculus sp. LEGE 07092]